MWVDRYRGLASFLGLAGTVTGRKKLQKAVYLAQQMGFPGLEERFDYHHFGPYSEALAAELGELQILRAVAEGEERTSSGYPTYSYRLTEQARQHFSNDIDAVGGLRPAIHRILRHDARFLELAATLHFLVSNGRDAADAIWEVRRRKPDQGYEEEECRRASEFLRELEQTFELVARG